MRALPMMLEDAHTNLTDPYTALAPYYDLITASADDDIELFHGLARRLDAPVLELGVGTARVGLALAARGLRVHGIDRSEAMLALARQKARAAGLTISLERADLSSYSLAQRFGLIYCAADGFLHMENSDHQIAALRCSGRHLATGGRLVIDLPSMEASNWSDWAPGVRPLELVFSSSGPDGRLIQHMVTFTAEPSTQTRHMVHLLDVVDSAGAVRRVVAEFDLRFIFPAELPLLVAAAGLELDALYGGYDLEPYGPGSTRMVAVITAG